LFRVIIAETNFLFESSTFPVWRAFLMPYKAAAGSFVTKLAAERGRIA
jgi:hypothetical protein